MVSKTPFHASHLDAGARMVDFGGWDMPMAYGSQIEEHHQVRQDAGMFDVSHMTVVDVTGAAARDYLRHLIANDVGKLSLPGKAMYGAMLNESGGVVDDLIVYYFDENHYRVVVNATTRDKDMAWMTRQTTGFDVALKERTDLAMLAVQGPNARDKTGAILSDEQRVAVADLKIFQGVETGDLFIARTGYTGEDGYEIMLPAEQAGSIWDALVKAGVQPCGLGARDTLRLEAGMNLYGNDMDESISPLAANMGWTIAWEPEDRDFVGRRALEQQKTDGIGEKLVGLVLEERGIMRAGQKVVTEDGGEGVITSGTMSPTLGKSIAMARVPENAGDEVQVEIRNKRLPAKVVAPGFVRKGKALV